MAKTNKKIKTSIQINDDSSVTTEHYIWSIVNYDHITKQSNLIFLFPPPSLASLERFSIQVRKNFVFIA